MKKPTIIPISGKAQHGKDLTANELKRQLEFTGQKVLIVHYADYLKMVCREYLSWDGEKDEQGRHLLQYIGTNKARKNNPDIWVNVVGELILAIGEDYDYILIPDSRFPNEIDLMKEKGHKVISVRVNRLNFESTLTEEQKQHLSEISLDDYDFDYYLNCESGVENIRKAVRELIKVMQYV